MHPLQTYLSELHDIRSTGAAVKETSQYSPLANLLNAVGQILRPSVGVTGDEEMAVVPLTRLSRRSTFGRNRLVQTLQIGSESTIVQQFFANLIGSYNR